jgi:hypothetical protein
MYQRTAQIFADKINALFESEATLEKTFKAFYPGLDFDRTEHWAGIINKLLSDSWMEGGPIVKSEPTGVDKLNIIRYLAPLLDYNLFTQVLLNLQGYTGMFYMTGDAKKEIDRLKSEWPKEWKLDPFAPKAKMVKQADAITEEQRQYNAVLSTIRALHIISQFTPQVSFRVSPKGSTPAFADSRNISMIGMGGDKYLKTLPSLKTYYITWDSVPVMAVPVGQETTGVKFDAAGVPYPFISKSGGQVLQDVLFARKIMYEIFKGVNITQETCIMVPRMNSILIVADVVADNLHNAFRRLKEHYPMLNLVEGQRA